MAYVQPRIAPMYRHSVHFDVAEKKPALKRSNSFGDYVPYNSEADALPTETKVSDEIQLNGKVPPNEAKTRSVEYPVLLGSATIREPRAKPISFGSFTTKELARFAVPDAECAAPPLQCLPLTAMEDSSSADEQKPSLESTSAHDSHWDLESLASVDMQRCWSSEEFTNDASDNNEGEQAPFAWPDTDSEDNDEPSPHSQVNGRTLNLADFLPAPPQRDQNPGGFHASAGCGVYPPQGDFKMADPASEIYIPVVVPVNHPWVAYYPQAPSSDYLTSFTAGAAPLPVSPVNAPTTTCEKMPPSSKPRHYRSQSEDICLQETSLPITTMMIRNLPQHVTQEEFIYELEENGFIGSYDFVYVPYSQKRGSNKGFAFVNFLSSQAAGVLVGKWQRQRIFNTDFRKPTLNISPASIQGLEPNLMKWSCPSWHAQDDSDSLPHVVGERAEQLLQHLVKEWQM
mmetsp:Transcript_108400/g.171028  ORF Transcript_108400/g.171028 Transcript_108400/m.171028 type:complete len:456 (+) Transcript_108400:48-1415(+)